MDLTCKVCGEPLRIGTPGMGIIIVRECECMRKEIYHGRKQTRTIKQGFFKHKVRAVKGAAG